MSRPKLHSSIDKIAASFYSSLTDTKTMMSQKIEETRLMVCSDVKELKESIRLLSEKIDAYTLKVVDIIASKRKTE